MAADDAHHGPAGAAAAGAAEPSAAVAQRPGGAAGLTLATGDCWLQLRRWTPARLALGRAGAALPTAEVLRFGWDHAQARDAVHARLDVDALERQMVDLGLETLRVNSRAPDLSTYLMRPDLGRRLDPEHAQLLSEAADRVGDEAKARHDGLSMDLTQVLAEVEETEQVFNLALVVADGLSALAVQRHAEPVLRRLKVILPQHWRLAPVVLATHARVALGDDIGERLHARLVAMLIGERPGLSSPDSLGIYLTWEPHVGRTDAERNCISNIRPEGLTYDRAAHKLLWLCLEAHELRLTGVGLKERTATAPAEIEQHDPLARP